MKSFVSSNQHIYRSSFTNSFIFGTYYKYSITSCIIFIPKLLRVFDIFSTFEKQRGAYKLAYKICYKGIYISQ